MIHVCFIAIFSGGMIAAGNVQEEKELNQICTMAVSKNLVIILIRLEIISESKKREDVIKAQNYYCETPTTKPSYT